MWSNKSIVRQRTNPYHRFYCAQAREFKPSIIMMDEVDGLFFQRTQNERSDYNNGLVNTLLSLLDGLEVNNDVFVIGLKFTAFYKNLCLYCCV